MSSIPLLVCLVLATPYASAWASPLDLFGVGARSPGLASTGVAQATDYDAAYLNPAGLADTRGKHFTIGTMAGELYLYRDRERVDTDLITGLIIGGALPLRMGGVMRDRLGLGFGFHIPTEAINRVRHPLPGVPTHILLENRAQVVSLQGAVGVRVNQRLSLGLGMLILAELRGNIDVTSDASGRFTSFSEQQMLARLAPIAGARYQASENLSIGTVFRGVSRSDYDILVTNNLGDTLPVTLPTVRIAGTSQYDPLTVAIEAGWSWRPNLVFTGQLAYQRWSAYPAPTTNPVDGGEPTTSPAFHDIAVPRLAIEWHASVGRTHIDVRGGYSFFMSPAPEMDGVESLLDNHRHIGSAGLGLEWPNTDWPVRIDAWVQMHVLMPRTHEKDLALFEPGQEPSFDSMDTDGAILVGGLTMGVEL
jgi:hypothetical protein